MKNNSLQDEQIDKIFSLLGYNSSQQSDALNLLHEIALVDALTNITDPGEKERAMLLLKRGQHEDISKMEIFQKGYSKSFTSNLVDLVKFELSTRPEDERDEVTREIKSLFS